MKLWVDDFRDASWYEKGFHIDISPELIGYKPIQLIKLLQTKDRKYPNA